MIGFKKILCPIAMRFDASAPVRRALWISVLVLAVDQALKAWVLWFLPPRGISYEVLPVFNLVLSRNFGAGFGLFAGYGHLANISLIVLTLVIMVFLLYLLGQNKERGLHPLDGSNFAVALITGGALGNLADRIWRGSVVDFLDFHIATLHWPAFNIADSAITVGALLWLYVELTNPAQRAK